MTRNLHFVPSSRLALLGAAAALALLASTARGQTVVPPITVTISPEPNSITVPTTDQAREAILNTPGGVDLVPDTEFKNGPASTVRDILGWVPGIITQPKSSIDNRISIRGSGLTRNYGNRGVNLYMNGVPINSSDGLTDVFEIDPTAYRYTEIYKGANALRYGGNALGGAVNFVSPTGRDASALDARIDGGSFGFMRAQASTGGAEGAFDYFINLSEQREDGYRDHSEGHIERGNANFGYQFSPDMETRFYISANSWRQRLPGELTKSQSLNTPRMANANFVTQDQQRNIDSVRLANKTTVRFDETTIDFGIFSHNRHVDHPIFRYLDFDVDDYGGFVNAVDDRSIGGYRNRFNIGLNLLYGELDYREYTNAGNATKGALQFSTLDKSQIYTAYAEDAFYFLPDVALVAGTQVLHAMRERTDRFLGDGDQSGSRTYNIWSPKVGLLWEVDKDWQVFGNVSRSAEIPTFDANTFAAPANSNLEAQTATTYEIGTRGRRADFNWDLSAYRSELKNELQCVRTSPFALCSVRNVDRTVHQGVEAGFGTAFLKTLFAPDDRLWLNAAYTYNDFYFDGATYNGNSMPGVPKHFLRTELLYKHPSGFYAGPSVDWMMQSFYADNANSLAVDPYALLNFRLGFDAGSRWSGYLEGRNLLDKRYISSAVIAETAPATEALFNPGYGRAVYAGLRLTW